MALDIALATTTDGSAEGGDLVPEATRFAGRVIESVEWRAAGMFAKPRKAAAVFAAILSGLAWRGVAVQAALLRTAAG